MTTKNKNVYMKLNEARVTLQGMPLKKSGNNKFSGYQYFELGDFLPQIQEIFNKVGLCGIVSFEDAEAKLTIINCDAPEEQFVITSPMGSAGLKGCHEVQNIGAVETYQRRYLWQTALEIVESDILNKNHKADDVQIVLQLTEAQQSKVSELADLSGISVEDICNGFKVKDLSEIPQNKYAAICNRLKQKIEE